MLKYPFLFYYHKKQYGGPDGELGASMRYLTQRYGTPYDDVKAVLTDVGTEELAHLEMVCAMVHQLTRNLTPEQIKESGFDKYFVDHTAAVYPVAAAGLPGRAEYIQAKGDILADLHEDLAAEQKARVTYDNLIRLIDDPDILDPLRFLRQREIVHYQRFGEANLTHSNRFIYKVHNQKRDCRSTAVPSNYGLSVVHSALFRSIYSTKGIIFVVHN